MIPQVWVYAILGVLFVAGLGGSYVKGRSDGRAVEIADQAREDQIRMETLQLAQMAAAEEISRIQIVNKTVYQRATREVIEKPVYRDCLHTDDGLRTVNAALTGQAEPTGEGVVPGVDAAGRGDVRRNDVETD